MDGSQAAFKTQARALLLKNAAFQRRNRATNIRLLALPIWFCVLLAILQVVVNNALNSDDNKCGCKCLYCCDNRSGQDVCKAATDSDPCVPGQFSSCKQQDTSQCGLAYSSASQAAFCPVASPIIWPAFMQVPEEPYRALPYRPAAAMLYTGNNQTTADALAGLLFQQPGLSDSTAVQQAVGVLSSGLQALGQGLRLGPALAEVNVSVGTPGKSGYNYYVEGAFVNATAIFNMVPNCTGDSSTALLNAVTSANGSSNSFFRLPFTCTTGLPVPKQNISAIDRELFCGFKQSKCEESGNEFLAIEGISQAWDFGATTPSRFSLGMWYNDSSTITAAGQPPSVLRVNKGLNLATNAFLKWALGPAYSATLNGISEMPKPGSKLTLDFSSLLGPLFFTWLLELLLPVMVVQLVNEKERKLRIMMKMHGLGDGAYWSVMYLWYLGLYVIYAAVLIVFASIINLKFFRLTSYAFTIVFFLLWGFTLVSSAFLASVFFTNSKTALVSTYLYVFASGLLASLLLSNYMGIDAWWVNIVEIIPAFAVFRGLYIMGEYAFLGSYQGGKGLTFAEFNSNGNGLVVVFVILAVEAVLFLALAWYLEQILKSGTGVRRHPLFFLPSHRHRTTALKHGSQKQEQELSASMKMLAAEDPGKILPAKSGLKLQNEGDDVAEERQRVQQIESLDDHAIVIRDLRKIYPAQDGNPAKLAVQALTLAVKRGECFGLLGPNGAGKSSAIHMLVGLQEPTSGDAFVGGASIRTDMAAIYSQMGVCPQHDLLWDLLTPQETLRFYGRLKNLQGPELEAAVEKSLRSVNLWGGGVAQKQVGKFSGGMKRRLSVAISLIGTPGVVYMDEPSTGLDPASRRNLWDVVKASKPGRGIILTTHSMEEAEVLCDRLGIFVDGQLVCIGNPKELTARYGGYLVFTVTTPVGNDVALAEEMVRQLCPGAVKTYSLAGTQKYEMPAADVSLSSVFAAIEAAKSRITILDWGISNATLEEVFIKFARSLGVEGGA